MQVFLLIKKEELLLILILFRVMNHLFSHQAHSDVEGLIATIRSRTTKLINEQARIIGI